MNKVPPAPDFNIRAHEEQHDEDTTGIGLKQASLVPPGSGFQQYFFPFMFYIRRANTRSNGSMKALPFWVGRSTPVANLYCEYDVESSANGVVRMGIYQGLEEYGWFPGPLVVDAGTAVTTTVGGDVVSLSVNQTLDGGNWYWIAAVQQGSPGTGATFFVTDGYVIEDGGGTVRSNTLFGALFGSDSALSTDAGIFALGVTGALPDPWPYDADSVTSSSDVGPIEVYYSTSG
jgi:hypothetical protein